MQEDNDRSKKEEAGKERKIASERADQALLLQRKIEEERNEVMKKFIESRKQLVDHERAVYD